MKIQPFTAGPYGTCCYIVYSYNGTGCVIIDAPFPADKILSFIEANKLSPEAVCLTHAHYDHIFGLAEIRKHYAKLPIYLGKEDFPFIEDGYSGTIGLLQKADPFFLSRYALPLIDEMPQDFIPYSDSTGLFSIIKTPGHTMGSVSLYSESENAVFTGDTLFHGSVGRTDLGGDYTMLLSSLKRLSSLSADTLVLPGHGTMTDIGTEKAVNPYL